MLEASDHDWEALPRIVDGMQQSFQIDGWECDRERHTFGRLFSGWEGRKYRITGRFVQLAGGSWMGEFTGLSRLMTRDEYGLMKDRKLRDASKIDFVPTLAEAREALREWLKSWDREAAMAQNLPAALRGGIGSDLGSKETFGELDFGGTRVVGPCTLIGQTWAVWPDDLRFQKTITRPGGVPLMLCGQFEQTPTGRWKAVGPRKIFPMGK
jgi:hypothetical protein